MSNNLRDIMIICLCILFLGGYFALKTDWEDMLTPVSTTPVHLNGKIASTPATLPAVSKETIPAVVYESMEYDKKLARYLTGNQKYILVVTFAGTPKPSVFKKELKELLKTQGYTQYYRRHFINLGGRWMASCRRHETCPELWIYKNCAKSVCIINPHTKQAIIDRSANAKQLRPLLEKYKEW